MNCGCYCHDLSYSGLQVVPKSMFLGCCPVCDATGELTLKSMWKIVQQVDLTEDWSTQSVYVRVSLRLGPGASPLDAQVIGFQVAKQWLHQKSDSVREIILMKIRELFAKDGMPQHLQNMLGMSDYEAQQFTKFQKTDPAIAEALYSSPPGSKPGVYISGPAAQLVDGVKFLEEDWSAPSYAYQSESVDGQKVVSDLRRFVPGILEYVFCPVEECSKDFRIVSVVQHLNDHHLWSREQIADWLETLDVDLSFPTEPPEQPPLPTASASDTLWVIAPSLQAARYEADRRRRPKRMWEYLDPRDAYRLRGHYSVQYAIVENYDLQVPKRTQQELLAARAIQVGEEHPRAPEVWMRIMRGRQAMPSHPSSASLLQAVYSPIIVDELQAYKKEIAKAQAQLSMDAMEKHVEKLIASQQTPITFDVGMSKVAQKPPNLKELSDQLKAVAGKYLFQPSPLGEWLDSKTAAAETGPPDPLALKQAKAAQGPHYQQFTDNPTKSKPKKKEK